MLLTFQEFGHPKKEEDFFYLLIVDWNSLEMEFVASHQ